MATKTRLVGFNPTKMKEQMMALAVANQTERLVEYAKKKILEIGNMINSYNSRHHMDRTGNLLNSLCWCVIYNGEMKDSGFYRDAVTNGTSFLHEFFVKQDNPEEVNGRELAEDWLSRKAASSGKTKGWKVVFAILAPYWGYWESGFTFRGGGGNSGIPRHEQFMQFQVMSHFFDEVRMDLKPAKTRLTVYVPKYSYKSRSEKGKKYKNRPFTYEIGKLR